MEQITTDTNTDTLKIVGDLIAIKWTGDNEPVFDKLYPATHYKKYDGTMYLSICFSMPVGWWLLFTKKEAKRGLYESCSVERFLHDYKPQFDKLWNEKHQ